VFDESLVPPAAFSLHITASYEHLDYVGRVGIDPDRRWMDWRIIDWLLQDLTPSNLR
jgi:hypothetical protein